MDGWQGLLVGLSIPVLGFLGVWLTYRSTKGRTQSDHKSAQDQRLDDKMNAYTDRIEKRLETEQKEKEAKAAEVAALSARQEKAEEDIRALKTAASASARREMALYFHTSALRDHIIKQLPPPPPAMPAELEDWFDNFDDTLPLLKGTA